MDKETRFFGGACPERQACTEQSERSEILRSAQNDITCQFVHATPPVASSGLEGAEREEVLSQYGRIPAFFIENKGQIDKEVKYYFKENDSVYFTDEGVVFQKIVRSQQESEDQEPELETPDARLKTCNSQLATLNSLAYHLDFVGARPSSPQARNALKGKVHYFIGNDHSK